MVRMGVGVGVPLILGGSVGVLIYAGPGRVLIIVGAFSLPLKVTLELERCRVSPGRRILFSTCSTSTSDFAMLICGTAGVVGLFAPETLFSSHLTLAVLESASFGGLGCALVLLMSSFMRSGEMRRITSPSSV